MSLTNTICVAALTHSHAAAPTKQPLCRPLEATRLFTLLSLFTLCSGHLMEKLSSFKTQPEKQTEQKHRMVTDTNREKSGCAGAGHRTWLNGTPVVIVPGTTLLETSHYRTRLLAHWTHLQTGEQWEGDKSNICSERTTEQLSSMKLKNVPHNQHCIVFIRENSRLKRPVHTTGENAKLVLCFGCLSTEERRWWRTATE